MTFRPDFLEAGWNNDEYGEEFGKIIKNLGVKTRHVEKIRRANNLLVVEYTP